MRSGYQTPLKGSWAMIPGSLKHDYGFIEQDLFNLLWIIAKVKHIFKICEKG